MFEQSCKMQRMSLYTFTYVSSPRKRAKGYWKCLGSIKSFLNSNLRLIGTMVERACLQCLLLDTELSPYPRYKYSCSQIRPPDSPLVLFLDPVAEKSNKPRQGIEHNRRSKLPWRYTPCSFALIHVPHTNHQPILLSLKRKPVSLHDLLPLEQKLMIPWKYAGYTESLYIAHISELDFNPKLRDEFSDRQLLISCGILEVTHHL
jgi:hypothetical protein